MSEFISSKKGVILYIVLAVIIIVLLLAATLLTMMSSQTNFASHQIGRIQAYYAGMAGMNWALENLRLGTWTYATGGNSCPYTAPCSIIDSSFPGTIVGQTIYVNFCDAGKICNPARTTCNPPAGTSFCINVIVPYQNP